MTLIILLATASLLAGFVDAVVGGGGLVQIPALLILLPGTPVATILGTNKFSSCFGTTVAVQRYARQVAIDWSSRSSRDESAFDRRSGDGCITGPHAGRAFRGAISRPAEGIPARSLA